MELNLYQKINEVKKAIKTFSKDKETEGYGSYSYTSGTQILSAIKDKMEELQLLFLPIATEHQSYEIFNYKNSSGKDKTDFIVIGKVTYEWINAEKPEERQGVDWVYYGQQNDISKAFGSGLTYAERYFLLKSLGVPTDEDDPDSKTENKPQSQDKTPIRASKYSQVVNKTKEKGINLDLVNEWIAKKFNKVIQINKLTDEQFSELMNAIEKIGADNE